TRSKRDWSSDVCSSDLALCTEFCHPVDNPVHNMWITSQSCGYPAVTHHGHLAPERSCPQARTARRKWLPVPVAPREEDNGESATTAATRKPTIDPFHQNRSSTPSPLVSSSPNRSAPKGQNPWQVTLADAQVHLALVWSSVLEGIDNE